MKRPVEFFPNRRICSDPRRGIKSRQIESLAWVDEGNRLIPDDLIQTRNIHMLVPRINYILMNFIRDDQHPVLNAQPADSQKLLLRKAAPGGIVWIT